MKRNIYSLLAALMAVVCLTACDDWTPAQQKFAANTGGVNLGAMAVTVTESRASRAGDNVDTSGFLVTITDRETGATAVYNGQECSWVFSKMPEVMTLPVGSYTVNVASHTPAKAEWSRPYFEGSKEFEITDGEITPIGTVTCRFAAIKVDVKFAADLAEAMSADSQVKVDANDEGSLTWTASETRTGYFEAIEGSSTIVATFTGTVKGQKVTRIKEFTDVEKGKYYIITFSLKTGPGVPDETGFVDPEGGITVDSSIEESDEDGNIDTPEDPMDPNGRPDDEEWPEEPTPPGPDQPDQPGGDAITITSATMPDFSQVYPITLSSYELKITSEKPLAHLYVDIESDYLTDEFLGGIYLASSFDLAEPKDSDGKDNSALLSDPEGFNFPVGDRVVGQTEVNFNLTPFIPLLKLGTQADPPVYTHSFKIRAVDNEGNEKTAELKFDVRL